MTSKDALGPWSRFSLGSRGSVIPWLRSIGSGVVVLGGGGGGEVFVLWGSFFVFFVQCFSRHNSA